MSDSQPRRCCSRPRARLLCLLGAGTLHAAALVAWSTASRAHDDAAAARAAPPARTITLAAVTPAVQAALPAPDASLTRSAPLPLSPATAPFVIEQTLSAAATIDDDFQPAEQLDRAPSPIGEVAIAYPTLDTIPGRVTVRLTLFIDEAGRVVNVESDPQAPEPFAQAARLAFAHLTFTPGALSGGPVKSRLQVEVAFDGGTDQELRI